MTMLLLFALAWAAWRGVEQVGRDTRASAAQARRSAQARVRREAAVRAARIRGSGTPAQKGALWAGTTGAAAARTTGRGLLATGRGAARAGRSFRTGWQAGWAEGKVRHADYVARREHRRRDPAKHTTPAVRGDAVTAPGAGSYDVPAERGPGEHGHSDPATTDADSASVTQSPGRTAGSPRKAQQRGEGEGGASVSTPTTGEAPNIEAAREALKAIAEQAEATNTTIDQLSASLSSADMDSDTLGEVSEILEAADNLKAAADGALAGLDNRHQVMEEAVNSTPHAAKTEFYRH